MSAAKSIYSNFELLFKKQMNEQRLIEIEIKIAYQEDLIQSLNQVVIKQQQQIDNLEANCHLLYDRLKNLQDNNPEKEPLPPHY